MRVMTSISLSLFLKTKNPARNRGMIVTSSAVLEFSKQPSPILPSHGIGGLCSFHEVV
ncbi:MAG: hypothetical protein ACPLRZ_01375 [Thermovenabulum sp.]|uniref:hypothetical protein n=1 Tax=Thermovenabulum sp. TaxID=3100335 RepID=UPI003C7E9CC1